MSLRLALLGAVLAGAIAPACTSTAGVDDMYMSIDDDGARHRTEFFTDSSAISCIFTVGVGRKNVTFSALIRQIREIPFGQGGSDFSPVNKVITSGDFHPAPTNGTPTLLALKMVPTTLDATTNQLKQDETAPFNPGSYTCEVSIDGVLAQQVAFNVAYPPCPAAQLYTGLKCAGFYAISPPTVCPKAGASGDPDPTCTCEGDKGWECP